ncbi:MAG: hypothetical protein CMJ76_05755 [Planctomycetaceae bacterium]|nr:hypothetical protein [Planctomycetaceae bacterium]
MHDVIVIGAGISGLRCALDLEAAGVDYLIIEKNSFVGGRCSSLRCDGFILDRGFQVLLDSYDEVFSVMTEKDLGYQRFLSGALIDTDRGLRELFDPLKSPQKLRTAVSVLFSDIASFRDKWRLWNLSKAKSLLKEFDVQSSTDNYFQATFTERFQEEFLRPFWGSVFLDYDLGIPMGHFFELMKFFSAGFGGLPVNGMQSLPDQLFSQLTKDRVRLETSVVAINGSRVELSSGEILEARKIILALPQEVVCRLMDYPQPVQSRSSACVYFAANNSPFELPALRLNARTDHEIVKLICIPTSIQPNYAPKEKVLITVNLDPQFDYANPEVRQTTHTELVELFGRQVDQWEEIEYMRIPNALPDYQLHSHLEDMDYIACGDYSSTPSINNAFASGRIAATKCLEDY